MEKEEMNTYAEEQAEKKIVEEKQAAQDALAEAVTAATDEHGNFDWSKVSAEPEWWSDEHPNANFNAGVIAGLEATAEKFKARGDAAEASEAAILDNLLNGRIAPSQRGRGGRI